jgi:putative glutamine amidotransferase
VAGSSSWPALIGVSTSEVRRPEDHGVVPQGEPLRRELALGERYLDAVRAAGGLPVILAPVPTSAIDALLDRIDALCLSGGPDIHPSAYGAPEHPELGPTEPELDRFELALGRRAVRRRVPVLGICRGAQVLNVALGGTLHQHLPDVSELEHRHGKSGDGTVHEIELTRGGRLPGLLGGGRLEVNSFHHQAAATIGHGLRVAARAPDGTVEALEGAAGFTLGVQWHAEYLVERPEQLLLFEELVRAGREGAAPAARAA